MNILSTIREIETDWVILRIPEKNKKQILDKILKESGITQGELDVTFHKDRIVIDFCEPINGRRLLKAIETINIKGGDK